VLDEAPAGPPDLRLRADVPLVALDRLHAALADDLRAAFDRVLHDGGFVLGQEIERFEEEWAEFCGVPHCAGVASGTSALHLALEAAGIGAGDEVIVPAHTFIATALGVLHAGATPVLCDVEDATGLIDPRAVAAAIGPRTAAIIAVHLYGQPCDMAALRSLADEHDLFLLEDAAQAHGARADGHRAGSLADAAAFSFYPSKNLGALGDGGAVTTADPALDQRLRQLRNLGQRRKGEHVEVGHNARLDGVQAAFLREKLPHLEAGNAARRAHAAGYDAALPEALRPLPDRPGAVPVFHLYPVRTPRRDEAAAFLRDHGVRTGVHYSPAMHQHPALQPVVGGRPAQYPVAEAWASEQLSLPMFPELRPTETGRVVAACQAWAETL
jgi:dTDP-4-amino-4,6-dideoxygalactose transaminase